MEGGHDDVQNENMADCYAIYGLGKETSALIHVSLRYHILVLKHCFSPADVAVAHYMGEPCGAVLGLGDHKTWGPGAPLGNPCWPRGNDPPHCPQADDDDFGNPWGDIFYQSEATQLIIDL